MIVKGSMYHINQTEFLAIKIHNINFVTIYFNYISAIFHTIKLNPQ